MSSLDTVGLGDRILILAWNSPKAGGCLELLDGRAKAEGSRRGL